MGNNKAKIAELVLRRLAGGDPSSDFRIKPQEVILMIPKVVSYLWDLEYKQVYQLFGEKYVDTRFLTTFDDVPVLLDTAKNLKYCIIPALYMNLPGNVGCYHISPQLDQTLKFKMVRPDFLSSYNGLEARSLSGYVGFWVEGNRFYFTHAFDGIGYGCKTLLIKLICILQEQGDFDDLFLPEKIEFDVIDTLYKYYTGELTELKDTVADNRSTTTIQ